MRKVYRYPHDHLPVEYSECANVYPDGEEGVWLSKSEYEELFRIKVFMEDTEEIGSL